MTVIAVAALIFLAPAPPLAVSPSVSPEERAESVAYSELNNGNEMAAIRKLARSEPVKSGDPAALINLGTAYARAGMYDAARASFRAAADSSMRYDLELAGGDWMDSRDAARAALKHLDRQQALAVR